MRLVFDKLKRLGSCFTHPDNFDFVTWCFMRYLYGDVRFYEIIGVGKKTKSKVYSNLIPMGKTLQQVNPQLASYMFSWYYFYTDGIVDQFVNAFRSIIFRFQDVPGLMA